MYPTALEKKGERASSAWSEEEIVDESIGNDPSKARKARSYINIKVTKRDKCFESHNNTYRKAGSPGRPMRLGNSRPD